MRGAAKMKIVQPRSSVLLVFGAWRAEAAHEPLSN
jgi:hypothetical protein